MKDHYEVAILIGAIIILGLLTLLGISRYNENYSESSFAQNACVTICEERCKQDYDNTYCFTSFENYAEPKEEGFIWECRCRKELNKGTQDNLCTYHIWIVDREVRGIE